MNGFNFGWNNVGVGNLQNPNPDTVFGGTGNYLTNALRNRDEIMKRLREHQSSGLLQNVLGAESVEDAKELIRTAGSNMMSPEMAHTLSNILAQKNQMSILQNQEQRQAEANYQANLTQAFANDIRAQNANSPATWSAVGNKRLGLINPHIAAQINSNIFTKDFEDNNQAMAESQRRRLQNHASAYAQKQIELGDELYTQYQQAYQDGNWKAAESIYAKMPHTTQVNVNQLRNTWANQIASTAIDVAGNSANLGNAIVQQNVLNRVLDPTIRNAMTKMFEAGFTLDGSKVPGSGVSSNILNDKNIKSQQKQVQRALDIYKTFLSQGPEVAKRELEKYANTLQGYSEDEKQALITNTISQSIKDNNAIAQHQLTQEQQAQLEKQKQDQVKALNGALDYANFNQENHIYGFFKEQAKTLQKFIDSGSVENVDSVLLDAYRALRTKVPAGKLSNLSFQQYKDIILTHLYAGEDSNKSNILASNPLTDASVQPVGTFAKEFGKELGLKIGGDISDIPLNIPNTEDALQDNIPALVNASELGNKYSVASLRGTRNTLKALQQDSLYSAAVKGLSYSDLTKAEQKRITKDKYEKFVNTATQLVNQGLLSTDGTLGDGKVRVPEFDLSSSSGRRKAKLTVNKQIEQIDATIASLQAQDDGVIALQKGAEAVKGMSNNEQANLRRIANMALSVKALKEVLPEMKEQDLQKLISDFKRLNPESQLAAIASVIPSGDFKLDNLKPEDVARQFGNSFVDVMSKVNVTLDPSAKTGMTPQKRQQALQDLNRSRNMLVTAKNALSSSSDSSGDSFLSSPISNFVGDDQFNNLIVNGITLAYPYISGASKLVRGKY